MKIMIRSVWLDGNKVDCLIEGNRFSKIAPHLNIDAEHYLDGRNKILLPPYYNCHGHSAMTLLRGYADDEELFSWLQNYIWPLEAKFTAEDIYAGARLACLEMIKSGTIFFADMYWHPEQTLRAVEEMGMRASIGHVILGDSAQAAEQLYVAERFLAEHEFSDRIVPAICPHSIYTVDIEDFSHCQKLQEDYNCYLHTHLAETKKEVIDCHEKYNCSPVQLLERINCLHEKTIAAHCVHLSDRDITTLKQKKVKIVHNPVSNMKLSSGFFPTTRLLERGVTFCLGTDGCASNNNLDMGEEAKIAALLAKVKSDSPQAFSAEQVFEAATIRGAEAFGFGAEGIVEGARADCMLVDCSHYSMQPLYNAISNIVYSAHPEAISTLICDGKILMQERRVAGEDDIVGEFRARVARFR